MKLFSRNERKNIKDNYIKYIKLIFIIRNIFIHNGGKVNKNYKELIKENTSLEINSKGIIVMNRTFIIECINQIRNFIFEVTYEYYFTKYRKMSNELFHDITPILLTHIEHKNDSIPIIFEKMIKNKNIDESFNAYSIINKGIYEYNNNLNEDKMKTLNEYSDELTEGKFLMAKYILTNDVKAYDYCNSFITNDVLKSENAGLKLLNIYDWPIMNIARNNNEKIRDLLYRYLYDILGIVDEEELK
ncbi:TPA: hypothetical protein OU848_002746 [Staphylococcus aureus]|nr:hypothetical protein [Staphylococcus aureus]